MSSGIDIIRRDGSTLQIRGIRMRPEALSPIAPFTVHTIDLSSEALLEDGLRAQLSEVVDGSEIEDIVRMRDWRQGEGS